MCLDLTYSLKHSLKQNQEERHSQKRRRAKPGGHRLDGLPFLILDEGQEVVLGASSLVLPEDAVLTAARITDGPSLTRVQRDDKHCQTAAAITNRVRATVDVE